MSDSSKAQLDHLHRHTAASVPSISIRWLRCKQGHAEPRPLDTRHAHELHLVGIRMGGMQACESSGRVWADVPERRHLSREAIKSDPDSVGSIQPCNVVQSGFPGGDFASQFCDGTTGSLYMCERVHKFLFMPFRAGGVPQSCRRRRYWYGESLRTQGTDSSLAEQAESRCAGRHVSVSA